MSGVRLPPLGLFSVGPRPAEVGAGPRKRLAQMVASPVLSPTNQAVEVPTPVSSDEAEITKGGHKDLSISSILPFQYVDKLGVGASAVVDVVEDKANQERFAHKVFRPYLGRDRHFKEAFKNEIEIIKRLQSHPHIIQIHWSYTRGRELGMLLTPVANDKDLGAYLLDIHDTGASPVLEKRLVLLTAFGCLTSGLAYIHRQTIRHKDIKPQNILVHEGRVIYTDFGIALDANDQSTTTTGMSEAFTRRYCAPEVAKNQPRNRKSDVFSLGCVFVEMLVVLYPEFGPSLLDPRPYWTRADEVTESLSDQPAWSSFIEPIASVCRKMIAHEVEDRCTADHARAQLLKEAWIPAFFCDDCRQ
jgi:serine/threonine protein kinase